MKQSPSGRVLGETLRLSAQTCRVWGRADKKEMLLCQGTCRPGQLVCSKAGQKDEAASLRTRSPGLPTAGEAAQDESGRAPPRAGNTQLLWNVEDRWWPSHQQTRLSKRRPELGPGAPPSQALPTWRV